MREPDQSRPQHRTDLTGLKRHPRENRRELLGKLGLGCVWGEHEGSGWARWGRDGRGSNERDVLREGPFWGYGETWCLENSQESRRITPAKITSTSGEGA